MEINVDDLEKALLDQGVDIKYSNIDEDLVVVNLVSSPISLGPVYPGVDQVIVDTDDLAVYIDNEFFGSVDSNNLEDLVNEIFKIAVDQGLTLG